MAHVFTALEDKVTGWQLSSATQKEIIDALSAEAQAGLLAKLSMTFNASADCTEFVFRYKTDSMESTLSVGDYLVALNNGNLVVKDATDFEANYLHTDCDVSQPKTQKFVDAMLSLFKEQGITSTADFTIAKVGAAISALGWIDTTKNIITLKLADLNLNEFDGFEILYKGACHSSAVDENTTIVLDLTNSSDETGNLFNLIALQQLLGIFARMDKTQRARLTSIKFTGSNNTFSAVGASVSEAVWMDWIDSIRDVTGIARNSAVTR